LISRAIKTVADQQQASIRIRAVRVRKIVKVGEIAAVGVNGENRAPVIRATLVGCAIKAVARDNQAGIRIFPDGGIGKIIEICEIVISRVEGEQSAKIIWAAIFRSAIKRAARHNQSCQRMVPITCAETMERGVAAAVRSQGEDRAGAGALRGCAKERVAG
jgi:hypothetical protein